MKIKWWETPNCSIIFTGTTNCQTRCLVSWITRGVGGKMERSSCSWLKIPGRGWELLNPTTTRWSDTPLSPLESFALTLKKQDLSKPKQTKLPPKVLFCPQNTFQFWQFSCGSPSLTNFAKNSNWGVADFLSLCGTAKLTKTPLLTSPPSLPPWLWVGSENCHSAVWTGTRPRNLSYANTRHGPLPPSHQKSPSHQKKSSSQVIKKSII